MIGRHFLAMAIMMIGFMLGVILAVTKGWQTGLVVGVTVVGCAWLFALANMYRAMKSNRF